MRVLHVINTMDPTAGGPPAVAARLAAAQVALGARATIAAYADPANEARTAKSLAGIPAIDRVELVRFPAETGRLARVLASNASKSFAALADRHDVLHLHGVWDPILPAAAAAARAIGRPYVVMPHGMLDAWSLRQSRLKWLKKKLALTLIYKGMLNRAAFLHTLNRDERDLLTPLKLRSRAEIFPNGIFLDEFANLPALDAFRTARPELGADPYILFLSRLHFKKGLDYLADAFSHVLKQHPTARLVVAGPDDGALTPFNDQCRTLGISDRVHAVGPLYGPDKFAALRGSACFCLPSRQEGFSMAITEAMACGVPVVISKACHFPEVAEAHAGHVVDLVPTEIASQLSAVLSLTPESRADMGRRGRQLVETQYTWPVIARNVLNAYGKGRASTD